MSDSSDPQAGTPPVTKPQDASAHAGRPVPMTGGGPLQWEPPTVGEAARLFPNYEILGLVGRRRKSAVYKARQLSLDRLVAIKLLPLEIGANQDFKERFVREARTMAKLNHPNILAMHDFGATSEGHLFIVMEYTAGANLRTVIYKEGLSPEQALYVAGKICEALTYAHRNGVIHRNIKPDNVMVNRDSHVKVAEFGLAQLIEADPEKRGAAMKGKVVGTLDYMAPEQKRGMNVDHRADIYSLGVVLYEMLCREVPLGAFEPPSRRAKCDERVDAIVSKALQQSPERRYQSTAEMKAALKSIGMSPPGKDTLAAMPKVGPPVSDEASGKGKRRRSAGRRVWTAQLVKSPKRIYAAIAAAALVVAIGIGIAVHRSKPEIVDGKILPPKTKTEIPPANAPAPKPAPVATVQPAPGTPEAKISPAPPRTKPANEAAAPNTTAMNTRPAPVAEISAPAPADSPQQSETVKWLAEQEPQWRAAFALEVETAFDHSVAELKKKYLSTLDTQIAAATRAGNLEEAVAYRDELRRMDTSGVPKEDDPATPLVIKAIRATYRKDLTALEVDRAAGAKAVHARYDAILAQSLTVLTKSQRFDEALLLRAKREQLAAEWLKDAARPRLIAALAPPPPEIRRPFTAAAMPATNSKVASTRIPATVKTPPVVTAPATNAGNVRSAEAGKDQPFENSLGMRFVPVPILGGPSGGQRVLFSMWETRVKDFEPFAKGKKLPWPRPGFPQGPTHPAVNMDLDEARDFCAWLTERERKAGRLDPGERYRLPTDHEWSCAAGIGERENPAKTPEMKNGGVPDIFPWGTAWPRPATAGNYKSPEEETPKPGAQGDHFPYTAPAGSFPPNALGIFDLGGNVWEWCDELFGPKDTDEYSTRGGCFVTVDRGDMLSARRLEREDDVRSMFLGFRVVLSGAGPGR